MKRWLCSALLLLAPIPALAGTGNCGQHYIAPSAPSDTAGQSDDGTLLSPANAPGAGAGWAAASLPVALPLPSSVSIGWTMCLASEANKAAIANAPTLAAPGVPSL